MRVIDSEKAISLLEKMKRLLPDNNGILPQKYLSKDGMDEIIQGLRKRTLDLDIFVNMISLSSQKKDFDILLASFEKTSGDIPVFIIGRKEADGKIQIVNYFQGREAENLYERLVEKNSGVPNDI